jgi:hypothetical protein
MRLVVPVPADVLNATTPNAFLKGHMVALYNKIFFFCLVSVLFINIKMFNSVNKFCIWRR